MENELSRPLQLIEYLKELVNIRSKVVYDTDDYERSLWLSTIPTGTKYCSSALEGAGNESEAWLSVRRFDEPIAPGAPDSCVDWIERGSEISNQKEPRLLDEIEVEREREVQDPEDLNTPPAMVTQIYYETQFLRDHPEVRVAHREYVSTEWTRWATNHQEWQFVQKCYSVLFEIHQDRKRLGEDFELVLGLGHCQWSPNAGKAFRRHLLTIPAELNFDAEHGSFEVGPAPDSGSLAIELEMLDAELQLTGQLKDIRLELNKAEGDPWDRSIVAPALHALLHSIDAGGAYDDEHNDPQRGTRDQLQASRSPALILRKRSKRGLLRLLDEMIGKMAECPVLPPEFARLCESLNPGSVVETRSNDSAPQLPEEVFFPLPSNDEQREILSRLDYNSGVLVQGPPGTGKSHTIANLICHLLATGNRVLVTAQTPRALEVLQSKLPTEIQALCITMLGVGVDEQISLERSVQGIIHKRHHWNAAIAAQRLVKLESSLASHRKGLARIDAELRDIRESETRQHSIAMRFTGTAATIAREVHEESERYAWVRDSIAGDLALPLSPPELQELKTAATEFSKPTRHLLSLWRPDQTTLITPEGFKTRCEERQKATDQLESSGADRQHLDGFCLNNASIKEIQELAKRLEALERIIRQASRRPLPWLPNALRDVLGDQGTPWITLYNELDTQLLKISALSEEVAQHEVAGIADSAIALADSRRLHEHLAGGGKLRIAWLFTPAVVKETRNSLAAIRVDGATPLDTERLEVLIAQLLLNQSLRDAWHLAKPLLEREENTPIAIEVAHLTEVREALHPLLETQQAIESARAAAEAASLPEPSWHDETNRATLSSVCAQELQTRIQLSFDLAQREWLAPFSISATTVEEHPESKAARKALQQSSPKDYEAAHTELEAADQLSERLQASDLLLEKLRERAPLACQELDQTTDGTKWQAMISTLPQAWEWAQARTWIDQLGSESDLPALRRKRLRTTEQIGTTLAEMAATKAWQFCLSRLKDSHQQYLVAWQQAIKKLGKGTGKYAPKHRRDAQSYLGKCLGSIPAWVMPLHRVFDTVTADPSAFDVIIVDEASQCGPDALPLLFLGKKIIIVGDDKQISPIVVNVNHSTVHRLAERHLGAFEMRDRFDLETSLFAHAELRFGGRIVLREHFRCAPEIIRFSNDLCYSNTPLVPLKQTLPDRLPPLESRYIKDGYREGKGDKTINRPEAEALVAALTACLQNERYDGMSFGVIALQGKAQAQLIQTILLSKISPAEFALRRIVCGEAYSFQGDERDVIFMSMVTANNVRTTAFTQAKHEQRFNVSASRACQQMWLFHSVELSDLSTMCFRRRLLEHFLDPTAQLDRGLGFNPEELLAVSLRANRQIEDPPVPFDSWFEIDVALAITAKGFRVRPQLEIAGFRIDLVVEGISAQLAVECDGDYWHGPDQYDEDMLRQQKLERCGWQFVRIRESAFYSNRKSALDELWTSLGALGIVTIREESTVLPGGANPITEKVSKEDGVLLMAQDLEASASQRSVNPTAPDSCRPDPYSQDTAESNEDSAPAPVANGRQATSIPAEAANGAPCTPTGGTNIAPRSLDPNSSRSMATPKRHAQEQPSKTTSPSSSSAERAPFSEYDRRFVDPRTESEEAVRKAIIEIIKKDGPLPKYSAFRLYSRNSNFSKLTKPIRQILNRITHQLVRSGRLVSVDEYPDANPKHAILRVAGTANVVTRELGDRNLEDVPPSEIAEQIARVIAETNASGETLSRLILKHYGLVKLTEKSKGILDAANAIRQSRSSS